MYQPKSLVAIDSRDINATSYDTPLWIEKETGHVWLAYVNSNMEVILLDGLLSDLISNWRRTLIHTANLDDTHNLPSVGIDHQGRIHIVYDLHNSASIKYKISTSPRDTSTLTLAGMDGTPTPYISYPRFHKTGNDFYFFGRTGQSGSGDVYIKRFNYNSGRWEDFAVPFLTGKNQVPPDNAYLGSIYTEENGNINLIWTHRIDWWNQGLFYAKYNAQAGQWQKANGSPYPLLPIVRDVADPIIAIGSPSDQYITNSGHAVSVSPDGTIHVVYHRYPIGYREVFHARYDPLTNSWIETQISDLRLPRLDGCPGGPKDERPRPCHMEMSGPTLIAHNDGSITVLYTRTTAISRGAWARPGGITYRADSNDNGNTWYVRELSTPVNEFGSEFPREPNGLPYILWQEAAKVVSGIFTPNGSLYLAKVDPLMFPSSIYTIK